MQDHLGYGVAPLLSEPWILDADVTVKPLYGHQDGAVKGYNPHKPGRPSHTYPTDFIANLRLVLERSKRVTRRPPSTARPGCGNCSGVCPARPGQP